MNDQGSLTIASRVKKEMPSSGAANGNNAGGVSDRYAAAAASALAKGEKRSNVAGFLAKAYQIFDNPTWSEICGWGEGGETVVIRKQIEFAQQILPLFFSHSNLQSFVRQLNMYNFRKVVQDPNSGEFKHDLFRKGNEHLLHKIKRKQSATAASATSNVMPPSGAAHGHGRMAMAGGIVEEAGNVLDELVKLRKWKEDMENTVVELKRDKQTLQSENQMLKGQVAEHGQQQMVLQGKMQKILYCLYDAYVSGLPALTASGEPEAGGLDADAIVKSESLVAASPNGSGAAAGSSLEKALQQLAALTGLNMASKIDQLHMENPWALGGAAGGGEEFGAGAGGAAASAAATKGTGLGGAGTANGGSGNNGTAVVGGGSLKRNRTWSQTSQEWLRSLRDPDPLDSIGSPASSAQADPGSSVTPDAHASAAADSPGDVGFSTRNDLDATTSTTSLTPERSSKRQRRSSSVKVEGDGGGGGGGGGGGSSAASSSATLGLLRPPSPSGAIPMATSTAAPAASRASAAGDPTGEAVTPAAAAAAATAAVVKDTSAHSPSGPFHKNMSFLADAPLSKDMSISGIVEEAEETKSGVAAAGGNQGSGEIWGGGALCRKLSEQATQVVSELGEMGHREGEALTKIDSLGYQLANLLDPNITFDEVNLFDEPHTVGDVTVPRGVDSAADDGIDDLTDRDGVCGTTCSAGLGGADGNGVDVAGGADGDVTNGAEASAEVDTV
eukprot:g17392.t1